eukprot:TRINITY_DN2113_c0_g1_i1.p1 TRINITY_DN2113_c0_g1~~TRINITY_DN2113_c0_g1_i1.p1  ORF type:complete len:490 (-),score=134.64 TRINITY_DN2113_c0_g1_i1:80-1549(-)
MEDVDGYFTESFRDENSNGDAFYAGSEASHTFTTDSTNAQHSTNGQGTAYEHQPEAEPEQQESAKPPLFDDDDLFPEDDDDLPTEQKDQGQDQDLEGDYNEADYADELDDEDRDDGPLGESQIETRRLKKRKRTELEGEYPAEDGEYDPNQAEAGEVYDGEGGLEEETPAEPVKPLGEDELLEKQFEDEVLAAVKRDKATMYRKKRIRLEDMDKFRDAYNNEILSLAERMSEARREDIRSVKEGKIALAKLKMLDEVVRGMQLRNPAVYKLDQEDTEAKDYIPVEFVTQLSKWLEVLPSGALPTLKIRESILKNLDRLHVNTNILGQSGIGKQVMLLSKHKKELESNRRICKQLISKWIRPIFGIRESYTGGQDEDAPQQQQQQQTPPPRTPPPRARPSQSPRVSHDPFDHSGATGGEDERPYSYFPPKSTMDYHRKPRDHEGPKKVVPKMRDREQALVNAFKDQGKSRGNARGSSVGLVRMPRASDKK